MRRVAFLVALCIGCGGSSGSKQEACVPGMAIGCACANGTSGAQMCLADGSSYSTCSCSGGGGGNSSGVGGSPGVGGNSPGTGGPAGVGGSAGTGGAVGTGETAGVGGLGTGGSTSMGGVSGTGGIASTGGVAGIGGTANTGGVGTGGVGTGGVGTGGVGTGGSPSVDSARYSFESTTQGWANSVIHTDTAFSNVYVSPVQHFAGASSLAGTITNSPAGTATMYYLELLTSPNVSAPDFIIPGSTSITFHVFVPVGAPISIVDAFVQEGPSAPTPDRSTITAVLVVPGNWITAVVNLPADVTPILRLGVVFNTTNTWTGTVFVDSVSW